MMTNDQEQFERLMTTIRGLQRKAVMCATVGKHCDALFGVVEKLDSIEMAYKLLVAMGLAEDLNAYA